MLVAAVNVANKELLAPVADTVRAELGIGAGPDEPDLPRGHGSRVIVVSLIGAENWRQPFIIYGVIGMMLGERCDRAALVVRRRGAAHVQPGRRREPGAAAHRAPRHGAVAGVGPLAKQPRVGRAYQFGRVGRRCDQDSSADRELDMRTSSLKSQHLLPKLSQMLVFLRRL